MTKETGEILVIGGTGKTGRRLVRVLRAAGRGVRAASRSGEVRFDWTQPTTWQPAVLGASAVYLLAPADPAADAVPAGTDLGAMRELLHEYARAAFPGLGAPVDEVVRLLTVLPGDDEDAYVLDRRAGITVLAGHNLFKLAPLLGERIADAAIQM